MNFDLMRPLLRPWPLAILMIIVGCNIFLLGYRWQLLLRYRGLPSETGQVFSTYLIGIFFNYALPGSVGGDVVKAYYVARDNPQRKMDSVATVLVDRIIGLYCMLLMTLMVIVWKWSFIFSDKTLSSIAITMIVLFVLMSTLFTVALSRGLRLFLKIDLIWPYLPFGEKFRSAYEAFHAYRSHLSVIFKSLIVSLLAQVMMILFMVYVGHMVGFSHVPLAAYFFAAPIGFIVGALPLAPAGVGVGQMAFFYLFNLYLGEETSLGPIGITAYQIALFVWGLWGAYFYLRRKRPVLSEAVS